MTNKKIAFLLLFITFMPGLLAWDWVASEQFDCNGCCIQGNTFQYNVAIKNTGSIQFFLDEIRLQRSDGLPITNKIINENIQSGESFSLSFQGNNPYQSKENIVEYQICLHLSEDRPSWLGTSTYTDWSCLAIQEYEVASRSDFKCFSDNNCPYNKFCDISQSCTSECKDVTLEKCGHIKDHKWVDYQCCSNSDCPGNKICSENYCVPIRCSCGSISNHICNKLECCEDNDCGFGYYCSSNKCSKYECIENNDCPYEKYCKDYKCYNLNCGGCEHIVEHNCIKYQCCLNSECIDDEICLNHLCEKLRCEFGYFSFDHECKKHECMVNNDCKDWEKCEKNNCVKVDCPSNHLVKYHGCENLKNLDKISGYVKNNIRYSYFSIQALKDFTLFYVLLLLLVPFFIISLNNFYKKIKIKKRDEKKIKINQTLNDYLKSLHEYIKNCRKKGFSDDKIIKNLIEIGWSKELINKEIYRFCSKCKHEITGEEKFCRKCGTKIMDNLNFKKNIKKTLK